MKVVTATPLTLDELVFITGKDALMKLGNFSCRYMSYSRGQEIEADYTYYDPRNKIAYGLKKVEGKKGYDYFAFRICQKGERMKIVFSKEDYRPLADGDNYEKKFVVLNPDVFKPEYQNAQCQLFYAESGFGCYPDKIGGKVYGHLFDEPYQTRREYILGVATEEAIQEWERVYGISRQVFMKGD